MLVQLLKPENFFAIIALLGTVLIMFAKSSKKRTSAPSGVGFAILDDRHDVDERRGEAARRPAASSGTS